ncbi:MAG TPA: glycoside hydrolase family 140 protein, partial [Puia sp.]|nr:glycoside hydrolase family 140 protein [Puia sp.]
GFTVIQAVAIAELDGLHTPNANGDLPLLHDDPARPNEKYFAYIDTLIDIAAGYHLYIALLPTWGDKVFKDWWGKGPEIFHPDNIFTYGKWIGNRFKNKPNLIWIIGGDRDPRPGSEDVAVWRALAKGITEGVGGADKALMSFHPQPKGTGSSSQWFQSDEWLDLNLLQTGHCRDTEVWETVGDDYRKTPVKPVVNGENIYEEMPVCFNAKELGYANAYDVRKAAYLSVFAGACGHTYGCGPVIFFGERGSNLFADMHGWKEALDLTAANEMKHLRALMESRPMLDRVPDQSMLASEGSCGPERIQATRGKDYAFVYSAYGRDIIVRAHAISGDRVDAGWFDPRTGKSAFIGTFEGGRQLTFTPPLPVASPVPSQREDWVLILDDAATKRWR